MINTIAHHYWRTEKIDKLNVLNQALGGGGIISEINSRVALMP